VLSQCERLEAELRKGRKLTLMEITNELLIGNHTGRISDLRPKFAKEGLKIQCEWIETRQGRTGAYSLVDAQNQYPERVPGKGDAYEAS
jgi:helix-turn-helix protein